MIRCIADMVFEQHFERAMQFTKLQKEDHFHTIFSSKCPNFLMALPFGLSRGK